MQVQPLTNNSFGAKNTFLQKSINAGWRAERDYNKSLHYEAKARMHYLKFQRIDDALSEEFGPINTIKDLVKALNLFGKMVYHKAKSVSCEIDAHEAFPNRFAEADKQYKYPHRYYKFKMQYNKGRSKIKYI